MASLVLVRLDSNYCDYLRQFDKRVPYNYDRKRINTFNMHFIISFNN